LNSPSRSGSRFTPFDLVLLPVLGGLMFALQAAMGPLPNIEPVTLLVTLLSLVLGWKVLISVYIFVLLEGLLYGFGTWWFSYLYIWLFPVIAARLMKKLDDPLAFALMNAAFGLIFGALTALPVAGLSGVPAAAAYIIAGIFPFDILHMVSNFVICLALFTPCMKVLDKLNFIYRDKKRP